MTPLNDETAVLPTTPDDEELVEERDDGLADELAKAAPKRWWNNATVGLAAGALLVGGFVGGLEAQKQWGTTATAGRGTGAFNGQNRAGYGFTGGGGNFGGQRGSQSGGTQGGAAPTAAAAGTTGTVKLVDGTTIYVQTANGDTVTVKTDGKTTVSTATKGKVSDVKAGQTVTVQGAAGTDGTVTATSVTAQK